MTKTQNAQSVTFAVDSVTQSNDPAYLVPVKSAVELLLGSPVEALSDPSAMVVDSEGFNVFLAAAHTAYSEHYPLALSPDIVWLTITQGLANHINLNPRKISRILCLS